MQLDTNFYCFDCDGVLWRGKDPIPEARDIIIKLKQSGKCIRFITNSSICTRAQHAQKITKNLNLTFEIEKNEVITAAYVTGRYLRTRLKFGCSILVLGLEGIKEELEAEGFKVRKRLEEGKDDEFFGAVVVGFDPEFNYKSIFETLKVFNQHPDSLFIACNLDATYIGEGGQIFPGTGSLVKAIEYAAGKVPIIMGKPNNHIYEALIESCPEFDPTRAVFIGDRLDSDIAFANSNKIKSILVETGVHQRGDIKEIIPSLCISNLSELHF